MRTQELISVINLFQELVRDHCYMAEDYIGELEAWTDNDYYDNNVTKIQLPYNAAVCILRFLCLFYSIFAS